MKYRGTQLSAWHHMSHKLERFTVWLFRENTCQSGLDSSAWTFFSSPMGTLLSSVNCLQTPRRLIFSGSFLGESCAHKWTVSSFHIGFTCSVPLPQAETSSSTPWCSQPLHTHAHTQTQHKNQGNMHSSRTLCDSWALRTWKELTLQKSQLKIDYWTFFPFSSLKYLLTPLTHLGANLSTREILSPFFSLLLFPSFLSPIPNLLLHLTEYVSYLQFLFCHLW